MDDFLTMPPLTTQVQPRILSTEEDIRARLVKCDIDEKRYVCVQYRVQFVVDSLVLERTDFLLYPKDGKDDASKTCYWSPISLGSATVEFVGQVVLQQKQLRLVQQLHNATVALDDPAAGLDPEFADVPLPRVQDVSAYCLASGDMRALTKLPDEKGQPQGRIEYATLDRRNKARSDVLTLWRAPATQNDPAHWALRYDGQTEIYTQHSTQIQTEWTSADGGETLYLNHRTLSHIT
jgi:hypothetical protein